MRDALNMKRLLLATTILTGLVTPALASVVDFRLTNVHFGCVSCPQTGTGDFGFDTTTDTVTFAAIFTTGPDPGIGLPSVPPEYTAGTFSDVGGFTDFNFTNGGFSSLDLVVADPLLTSVGSSNPLVNLPSLFGSERGLTDFWGRGISGSIDVVAAPEPGTLALLFAGLLGLWGVCRTSMPETAIRTSTACLDRALAASDTST